MSDAEVLYRIADYPVHEGFYDAGLDEYRSFPNFKTHLVLYKFPIIKRTKCGAWIDITEMGELKEKRFVDFGTRKKFACETIEEAIAQLRARKNSALTHAIRRFKHAMQANEAAKIITEEKLNESGIFKFERYAISMCDPVSLIKEKHNL